MIDMYLRTFITKILFFILSNLLPLTRIEVDTQATDIFPYSDYNITMFMKQVNF